MKANVYPGRTEVPDWNNIDFLTRDSLPPRAYLVQYPDLASCRHAVAGNARYASPYVLILNGSWSFAWYPSIARLPEKPAALRAVFTPTSVPSCWQLSGHGPVTGMSDAYPFPVNPPRVPDTIPVGVYRRSVRLPLTLGGLRKRITFHGVSSAFHLFVNGREAGYAEGAGLPAEFDITTQLHDGDNELMLYVYGYSAASYLDGHPGPVLNGIFRDVYIEATPPISVHDLRLTTAMLEESQWRLEIDAEIISYRISTDSPRVRVLVTTDESVLFEAESRVTLAPSSSDWGSSPVQTAGHAQFAADLTGVPVWTAETPDLCQVFVSVLDRQGHELSCVGHTVGFRDLSGSQEVLMLNGRPLRLSPVYWEGVHPDHGSALPLDDLIADIRQMKRHNINAVLTGPLPTDPIFLELCDIYGLYVIERVPVSFAAGQSGPSLANDPQLRAACLDRTSRLVARDRNFACVVAWSMAGGEPIGQNHAAMLALTAALDPSRPALAGLPGGSTAASDDGKAASDECKAESGIPGSEDRTGPDVDFWAAVLARPWHDRMLNVAGGEGPWSAEGLVQANHQPYTALKDLAQAYQPMRVEPVDAGNGALVLVNRRSFATAGNLAARFLVLRDGLEILAGELDGLRLEPDGRRFIELPFGDQRFDDGSEYWLRLEFEQAEDTLHAPAGHPVGFYEFPLSPPRTPLPPNRPAHAAIRLRLERDRHLSILSGNRFYLVFNHVSGAFDACRNGDKELFATTVALDAAGLARSPGPQMLLWRAPTGADRRGMLTHWQALAYDRLEQQIVSVAADCDGQSAVIEAVTLLSPIGRRPLFRSVLRQEVSSNGALSLLASIESLAPDLPLPPRLGLRFFLRPEYARATYYGLGPHGGLPSAVPIHSDEPRPQAAASQRTGLWRLPVEQLAEPSCRHQENGIRTGVRYLKLQDEQGFGVLIASDGPFLFTARTCAMEDLMATPAGSPLPRRAFTEVILDLHQASAVDPGGPMPAEPGKFAFTLIPIIG